MNSWMIAGIILLVGFFICLVLILRAKWKAGRKNIDDYQKCRDKLTFRKKKEKKQSPSVGLNFGNLMAGFVVILVGVSLFPIIAEEVGNACSEQLNESSAASTMLCSSSGEPGGILGLIMIFFAIAIVLTSIGVVLSSFRGSGLL